ncbi:MAG TPA: ABC transporter ATP-binding protein [Longimicrobiales bacterium]|nr:ABC transporter ATP-binding protein [Longimicrobiales bacterium]
MRELRTLLPYVRPYRAAVLWGIVLVVLSNAFGILSPKLLGMAIDALDRPGVDGRTILVYALLIVAAALLSGAARYGMRELLNGFSRRVETDVRDDLFRHLMALDAGFYARERTGDLMSRATNDTSAVRQAAGPAVMYTVNTVALAAFALGFMLFISPLLTGLALVPLLILPPLVLHFNRVIHARYQAIQDHFGELSTMVQENLSAARIVRAYVQEVPQEREFDALSREYLKRNMDLARTTGIYRPLLTLLTGAGMVIVLWLGGLLVMRGRISVGDFVAFGFYLAMMNWPMIALGWVTNLYQRGAVAMGRINRIMRTEPAVRDPARPTLLEEVRGGIEFRAVRFRYPGSERDVLLDISFRVEPGSTVALVGPTGSGKSTLVALLARLYDPTAGEVLLDGVPLPRLSLERIRGALGVVPQEAFLFSETLAANLALGLDGEEHDVAERVARATRIAQLDEAIAGFPHGLLTRIGERGINLSGGQRQRAALARALARAPRILVLDDALSAVDSHTERRILEGLREVLPDRTSLIISHRVSAVMAADRILVLDEGRIVERGTHLELLEAEGLYATLLRRQLLEEDLDGAAQRLAGASGGF